MSYAAPGLFLLITTGRSALGTYLNIILKIITDTSVYDTFLLKTHCSQTLSNFKSHEHRIIRLQKTSSIIESNLWPITTLSTQPQNLVPHLEISWNPPGAVTSPNPWAAHSSA